MLVMNIAGYNFGFKHKNVQYEIPFDFKIHSVPDDSPRFRELRILKVVETVQSKIPSSNNVVNVDWNFFHDDEVENDDSKELEKLEDLNENEVKTPKKRIFSKIKKKKP